MNNWTPAGTVTKNITLRNPEVDIVIHGSATGTKNGSEKYWAVIKVDGKTVTSTTIKGDGKTEILKAGQAHYCPKGHKHGMKNEGTEDLIIFGVVPKQ